MDPGPQNWHGHPLVLTGLGCVLSGSCGRAEDCDPLPYLKVRKTRKFMAKQDELALVAAGRALESAGLHKQSLGERTGLFLAMGYLPFEKEDIDLLVRSSVDETGFSMARFSTQGMDSVNPLLTFHCLPNMAAFHVSVNFDLQGPYLVTYPGPGQFYWALEEARYALWEKRIDTAILLGVAHQRNFLVEHHFRRLNQPASPEQLVDAAGCIVLETKAHADKRSVHSKGRLLGLEMSYHPYNPFEKHLPQREMLTGHRLTETESLGRLGAASLPVTLSMAGPGGKVVEHHLQSADAIVATSIWELF